MSARVGAARSRQHGRSDPAPEAVDEMLEAVHRIERAAQDIQGLNAVLKQVDKNITTAAKRAGRWSLRLNSRKARNLRCRSHARQGSLEAQTHPLGRTTFVTALDPVSACEHLAGVAVNRSRRSRRARAQQFLGSPFSHFRAFMRELPKSP